MHKVAIKPVAPATTSCISKSSRRCGSSGQSDLRTKADVQIRSGLLISDVSQAMIEFALTSFDL
jgi:hypothetical protein